jgi:metal-sulfur cluster biosynthetic enzyme
MTSSELRQQVIQVLRTIYDPEMPVNIYELGLIYEVYVDETRFVSIRMALVQAQADLKCFERFEILWRSSFKLYSGFYDG